MDATCPPNPSSWKYIHGGHGKVSQQAHIGELLIPIQKLWFSLNSSSGLAWAHITFQMGGVGLMCVVAECIPHQIFWQYILIAHFLISHQAPLWNNIVFETEVMVVH